jgi:hypothetical protein
LLFGLDCFHTKTATLKAAAIALSPAGLENLLEDAVAFGARFFTPLLQD